MPGFRLGFAGNGAVFPGEAAGQIISGFDLVGYYLQKLVTAPAVQVDSIKVISIVESFICGKVYPGSAVLLATGGYALTKVIPEFIG